MAATGCDPATRTEQADRAEQLPADVFLHEHLANEPILTTAGAYRAVILLAEGDDPYETFEQREAALVERDMVRPEWGLVRDEPIDRGSVAYMICRVIQVRGGVNARLFGSLGAGDRRYAMRELVYLGFMPDTPPYRYMTGSEMIDLLGQADAYMADRGMYEAQPVDIVDELEGVEGENRSSREMQPPPP
jgi:hypothetical protein